MSIFNFSLDSLKSGSAAGVVRFEASLYANTRDEDLTYPGDDYIVWDRVNTERLRRGLPSLASIGFPRPPEETSPLPSDAAPSTAANTFQIKGPPGMTREQAFEIFKKQANTGALVGFKPGDVLSAATQAADGLPSAQALLAQAQAGVGGSLGAGLGGLGVNNVQSGIAQAGGALGGSLASSAAGLTGLVGPAVSGLGAAVAGSATSLTSTVQGLVRGTGSAAGPITGALTGAASQIGSVAVSAVQTINKALTSTPVTNPINGADFLKTATALAPIASMSVPTVTGVLAQSKNLVSQPSAVLSNNKGLGSFGFDAAQLETAGLLKPGVSSYVATGGAALSTVLKSPAVWTGKDGVTSVNSLLNNSSLQDKVQQGLMASGLAGISAAGIPVSNLSAQGVAGLALNAAKSVSATVDYAKGLPIPGDATGAVKAGFDQAVRDGGFAANLVETKIPPAWKAIDLPVPKINTVNRDTVNAAASRIAGNDKIPPPNYSAPAPDDSELVTQAKEIQALIVTISQRINKAAAERAQVKSQADVLSNQQQITNDAWSALNAELQAFRSDYNTNTLPIIVDFESKWERADAFVRRGLKADYDTLSSGIRQFLQTSRGIKEQVAALQFKIAGYNETS